MNRQPVSSDLPHALQRMTQHACRLLIDAHVISECQANREHGGRGEYILRLVALEILMKAGALNAVGELEKFYHEFPDLFDAQPPAVRAWVESEFGARSLGKHFETARTLPAQLDALTSNYTRARYVYEPSIQFTESERLAREEAFLDGSLPESEWDIIFHHGLVRLLTEAMVGHLSPWLPDWFEPSSMDLFPPQSFPSSR